MTHLIVQPEVIKALADCVVDVITNKIDWQAVAEKACQRPIDLNEVKAIAEEVEQARPQGEWIAVTTCDMTEEEAKQLLDDYDLKDFFSNPEKYWQYRCRLPDDGQEVLVSTRWGVTLTTFYSDVDYGNYFEDYEDRFDVDAWMPLPKAYEKEADDATN